MSTDNAAPGYPIFERSVSAQAISAFGTSATCNEPQSTSELESKPEISSWTDRASLIGTGLRRGCVVGYLMGEGWVHM